MRNNTSTNIKDFIKGAIINNKITRKGGLRFLKTYPRKNVPEDPPPISAITVCLNSEKYLEETICLDNPEK